MVAPRTGAWIETTPVMRHGTHWKSRPARARGLKHHVAAFTPESDNVAPRTGAWIETRIKYAGTE